ncbi:hypothetical protein ACIA8G_03180 [Lentzea sp. NPDC051213]|uniref:hypothetical protein n=1 Tax=Lentzea sp. NPDC051213 TaxID=3364126 RepID=UPI0037B75984
MPGPGALVPDVTVGGARLRERHGFRVLAGPLTSVPGTRLTGEAAEALGARPDEVWVLRPDGCVAAVLRDPVEGQVACALERAGRTAPGLRARTPTRTTGG